MLHKQQILATTSRPKTKEVAFPRIDDWVGRHSVNKTIISGTAGLHYSTTADKMTV